MSGPITRRYGFPNFDRIFGPKPVLHGVDDEMAKGEGSKVEGSKAEAPGKADAQAAPPRDASEGGDRPVG
jgi:hypothetical protein